MLCHHLEWNYLSNAKNGPFYPTYIYKLRKSSLKEKLKIFTKSSTDLKIMYIYNHVRTYIYMCIYGVHWVCRRVFFTDTSYFCTYKIICKNGNRKSNYLQIQLFKNKKKLYKSVFLDNFTLYAKKYFIWWRNSILTFFLIHETYFDGCHKFHSIFFNNLIQIAFTHTNICFHILLNSSVCALFKYIFNFYILLTI